MHICVYFFLVINPNWRTIQKNVHLNNQKKNPKHGLGKIWVGFESDHLSSMFKKEAGADSGFCLINMYLCIHFYLLCLQQLCLDKQNSRGKLLTAALMVANSWSLQTSLKSAELALQVEFTVVLYLDKVPLTNLKKLCNLLGQNFW